MKMREFDESAWAGFAGAEAFQAENTKEALPLIGCGTFEDGNEYCLVLDRTGGCLLIDNDEQNEAGGYVLELPFLTQAATGVFAEGMGTPKGKEDFFVLGFKAI